MAVKDKKGKIIAGKVELADRFFSKAFGLMFSFKDDDKALVMEFKTERIVSLHMFFVFYAIDVLFLDKDKKIVEIKKGLKPFRLYTPKNKAKYVVELTEGKGEGVKVGDILDF